MTRWARVGNSQKHKKLPEDATPWESFWQKQNSTEDSNKNKVRSGRIEKRKQFQKKKFISNKPETFLGDPETKNNLNIKEVQSESNHTSLKLLPTNEDHVSSIKDVEFQGLSKKQLKKAKLQQLKRSHEILDNNYPDITDSTGVTDIVNESPKEKDFQCKKKLFMQKLEKKRKQLGTKPCFNCRQTGHLLAECPMKLGNSVQETGICFKCGSAEHRSYKCPTKIKGYPFAKCFICKEQGHISKDCPKNEHGVYVKGGKCILCGNVNHLKKDCPTLRKIKDEEIDLTAHTIDEEKSVDAEIISTDDFKTGVKSLGKKAKKVKVVKF